MLLAWLKKRTFRFTISWIVFWVFLSGVFTYFFVLGAPDLQTLRTTLLNGMGDELLVLWIFKQVCHNIISNPTSLFYGGIFYPHSSTLAFAEGMWIPSLFFGCFKLLFHNDFISYYAVITLFFALDFVAMYAFVRKIKSETAGFAAGLVFAFSMVRLSQVAHTQFFPQFFFPLVAGQLYDYENDGNPKHLYSAAFWIIGQVFSSVYLGMILVVSLIPYISLRICLTKNNRRGVLKHLFLSGLLAAVLLAPLAYKYVSVSQAHHIVRLLSEVHIYGVHITHFLAADPQSFWGPITERLLIAKGQLHEKRLFVGLAVLILIFLGIRVRNRGSNENRFWFWVLSASGVFSVWMAHGPAARLYTLFYYTFPGLKGLRVPARFGFTYLFLVAILAGFGADTIVKRKMNGTLKTAILCLLFGLFIFENHIGFPHYAVPKALLGVTEKITDLSNRDPLVHFPLDVMDTVRMYYSQIHGHPIFNGYSGFTPEPQLSFILQEREKGANVETTTKLTALGVKYAVVEKTGASEKLAQDWYRLLKQKYPLLWEDSGAALFSLVPNSN